MFTNLLKTSSTIIKDTFAHIRGKIGELKNQIRDTVVREIICFLLKKLSTYHHHHHQVTHLLCHHITPILPMEHHLYNVTCHPYPINGSTPSSCYPYPLYVDHNFSNIEIAIGQRKQIRKRAALSERWIFMRNNK